MEASVNIWTQTLTVSSSSSSSSVQSCHIDEEEEGAEQVVESAEDEMSFEVRQSELVMGDQGLGSRNTMER